MKRYEYGKLLRDMREKAGISQCKAAALLGISPSVLSDIERGTRPPLSRLRTIRLARTFKASMADVDDLLIAWAKNSGYFELPVRPFDSERRKATGAILCRRWKYLTEDELAGIERIVGKFKYAAPPLTGLPSQIE